MPKRFTPSEIRGLKPQEINFVIEYCKDFSARRAAEASGYSPDTGYSMREKPHIQMAVDHILLQRLEASHIDAEWLLMELADNHMLARQAGNISASNTALGIIGKHVSVDAFAKEKLELSTDREIMERLLRGRKRRQDTANHPTPDDDTTVTEDDAVSFI